MLKIVCLIRLNRDELIELTYQWYSVTRLGDLLDFGQLYKALGNI